MIEWIKYDKENPPEFMKIFLICYSGSEITSGYCDKSDRGRISWFTYTGNIKYTVDHYAEINLPKE